MKTCHRYLCQYVWSAYFNGFIDTIDTWVCIKGKIFYWSHIPGPTLIQSWSPPYLESFSWALLVCKTDKQLSNENTICDIIFQPESWLTTPQTRPTTTATLTRTTATTPIITTAPWTAQRPAVEREESSQLTIPWVSVTAWVSDSAFKSLIWSFL